MCSRRRQTCLKPAVDSSNLGRFSRDRQRLEPCMGRLNCTQVDRSTWILHLIIASSNPCSLCGDGLPRLENTMALWEGFLHQWPALVEKAIGRVSKHNPILVLQISWRQELSVCSSRLHSIEHVGIYVYRSASGTASGRSQIVPAISSDLVSMPNFRFLELIFHCLHCCPYTLVTGWTYC